MPPVRYGTGKATHGAEEAGKFRYLRARRESARVLRTDCTPTSMLRSDRGLHGFDDAADGEGRHHPRSAVPVLHALPPAPGLGDPGVECVPRGGGHLAAAPRAA